jgi:hypothetical protein
MGSPPAYERTERDVGSAQVHRPPNERSSMTLSGVK